MGAGHFMLRALGMFGLGGAFLIISPELRANVMGDLDAFGNFLNAHSPISYVCVVFLFLAGAMFWVYRAAQPR